MAQKDGVTITPPNVPFSILKEKGYIQKKPQCPLGYDYILDSSKTVLCPMHGDLKNFSKGDAPWTDKAIVLGIIVITTIILIVL
ncbi:hypothetical protein KAJ27_15505 [bacterium]|nr:hypothetical protein [bacterium]